MARMKGVFSNISGRVGTISFVNSSAGQYMKTPSLPRNPNTLSQRTNREEFFAFLRFAKYFNRPLIKEHISIIAGKKMSGWNFFCKKNRHLASIPINPLDFRYSFGFLEPLHDFTCEKQPISLTFDCSWNTQTFFTGKSTDLVCIILFSDISNFPAFVGLDLVPRHVGNLSFSINNGFNTSAEFHAVYFCRKSSSLSPTKSFASNSHHVLVS